MKATEPSIALKSLISLVTVRVGSEVMHSHASFALIKIFLALSRTDSGSLRIFETNHLSVSER